MQPIATGDCAECGKTAFILWVTDPRTDNDYGFCRTCITDEFDWWEEWKRVRDLKLETKDEDPKDDKLYCIGCRKRLNFPGGRGDGAVAKCPCGWLFRIAVGIMDGSSWIEVARI